TAANMLRGVERRPPAVDDYPRDDYGTPSTALRPPASGSRPTHGRGHHRHESRRPALDRPWVASHGTEDRAQPGRHEPGNGRTPARSSDAPTTREEAYSTPSAHPRSASNLGIHVDQRASARRTRQNQHPASRGSCP